MKTADPEVIDLHTAHGPVTLYDEQGRVIGHVDARTRIQTDTHGRAVRRVPSIGPVKFADVRRHRRSRPTNEQADGQK